MATTAQSDITVTTSWVDATVANTALNSVDVCLQNICPGNTVINVACGGTAAAGSGYTLSPGDSIVVNSGTIWVRSEEGGGDSNVKLAVSLV